MNQGSQARVRRNLRAVPTPVVSGPSEAIAEHLLREALDGSPAAVALWDADDRLVAFNLKYREFFFGDLPLEPRLGDRFPDLARAFAKAATEAGVSNVDAHGLRERIRLHRRADGVVEQQVAGRIIHTTESRTADGGTLSVHLDITQLKRVEEEKRSSENQYQALVEHMQDGLFMIRDGRFALVNEAFARMIGYTADELIGVPFPEVVAPEDRETVTDRHYRRLRSESVPMRAEFRLLHRDDGRRVPVLISVGLLPQPDGTIATIGTLKDETERNRAEAARRAAEREFREMFENATEGIYRARPDGTQLRANPAMVRLHGYSTEDEWLEAVTDLANQCYVDPRRHAEFLRRLHLDGRVEDFVSEIYRHRTRERIWVTENAHLVRDGDGDVLYIEGTVRNITKRRRAEADLRESEQRFRDLVEGSIQGILVHQDFQPLFANQACAEIFGYANAQEIKSLGSTLYLVASHEHERLLGYAAAMKSGASAPPTYEFQGMRRDGSLIWVETRVKATTWKGDAALQSTLVDVTQRKQAEQQIIHMASHDGLTGLPNRGLGQDRLALALARARRTGGKAALLFVDLDGFKDVNDSLGHSAGDRLLKALASRMAACVREVDTVARYGGDEFVIVLGDLTDENAAARVAETVLQTVSRPLNLLECDVTIGASIGIAVFPDHGMMPDALLRAADKAMYAVKQNTKGGFRFAEPAPPGR